VNDTIRPIAGRTIHTLFTPRGPAAATPPTSIRVCGEATCCPAHHPTRPNTRNTLENTSTLLNGVQPPGSFNPPKAMFAESTHPP